MKLKRYYLLILATLVVFVFVTREAHKEVFFLCSNFAKGDHESSVITQLDTAVFSDYTMTDSQIVLSSALNFHRTRCQISVDANHFVQSVVLK